VCLLSAGGFSGPPPVCFPIGACPRPPLQPWICPVGLKSHPEEGPCLIPLPADHVWALHPSSLPHGLCFFPPLKVRVVSLNRLCTCMLATTGTMFRDVTVGLPHIVTACTQTRSISPSGLHISEAPGVPWYPGARVGGLSPPAHPSCHLPAATGGF